MIRVILVQCALALLLVGCVQEYSPEEPLCPCEDGWRYCLAETGVNVCVKETVSCPCSGFIGEMNVDPENMPANGNELAEIAVWVFDVCGGKRPQDNIVVKLHSSRNQTENEMDFFEQPTGATDADGRVVAYVRSFTPGEATLFATANSETLCKTWSDTECLEPLQEMITFNP